MGADADDDVYDLRRWMTECCTVVEGRGTPLWVLHNAFIVWALHHDEAPIRRSIFEGALRSEGFRMEGHLVYALVLNGLFAPLEEESMDELDLMTKGAITGTQWLHDLLSVRPCSVADIRAAAWIAHFSWPTILAAKKQLGVHTRIAGVWELPEKPVEAPTQRQLCALRTEPATRKEDHHEVDLPAHRREDHPAAGTESISSPRTSGWKDH
jgi:hypothetical protein